MNAQEAYDIVSQIPAGKRNRAQDRTFLFLDTLKKNPDPAVWAKMRQMPIPPDIAWQLGDAPAPPPPPPKPEPNFAARIRKFLF